MVWGALFCDAIFLVCGALGHFFGYFPAFEALDCWVYVLNISHQKLQPSERLVKYNVSVISLSI